MKTTLDRIRELSQEGKSANEIQHILKAEQLGIRRTVLLKYVREFKGLKPKFNVWRFIPKKYRKAITWLRRLKQIAVYGKVDGVSHRLEISGTGKQIQSVLSDGVFHPPKKRVLRIDADDFDRNRDLDLERAWDDRPTIES